jgi:glucan phosphoethanolaminetransferase (alkaline phosphatase superfamily)
MLWLWRLQAEGTIMQNNSYRFILKRLGFVLAALGVLGFLGLGWSIGEKTFELHLELRPGFICALIAGILLLFGSLRAASVIRWLAIFFACGLVFAGVLAPVYVPLGLLLTELRLKPEAIIEPAAVALPLFLLLLLVIHQLSQEPIVAACRAVGVRMRSPLRPMVWSAGCVIAIVIAISLTLSNEDTKRAKDLALEQLGANYSYYVESLGYQVHTEITRYPSGQKTIKIEKSKTANVVAWNDSEIRPVHVRWPEN